MTHTQGSQKPSGLELFQLGLHVKYHENHSVHFFCKQAQRASSCDAALLEQALEEDSCDRGLATRSTEEHSACPDGTVRPLLPAEMPLSPKEFAAELIAKSGVWKLNDK